MFFIFRLLTVDVLVGNFEIFSNVQRKFILSTFNQRKEEKRSMLKAAVSIVSILSRLVYDQTPQTFRNYRKTEITSPRCSKGIRIYIKSCKRTLHRSQVNNVSNTIQAAKNASYVDTNDQMTMGVGKTLKLQRKIKFDEYKWLMKDFIN